MEKLFRGVFTAIVTPFNEDESVDYSTLEKLIERQINSTVDGIVVCGTTGESPTLSHEEHREVINFVIKKVNKRVKVIAGTGSNCTREAIIMSKNAEQDGADGLLLVNPYYNKPTQEGLYLHFKAINDSVNIPIIIYNIKGRTGVNVENNTMLKLISNCKNVIGVKEASGNLEQIKELIESKPKYFSVLSGDDSIALKVIKMGGDGIICTTSNFAPKKWSEMIQFALNNDFEKAEEINKELETIYLTAFIETNPIPIKCMLAMKGLCKEIYRLPMCKISEKNRLIVKKLINEIKFE